MSEKEFDITSAIADVSQHTEKTYERIRNTVEFEDYQKYIQAQENKKRYDQFLKIIDGEPFFHIDHVYKLNLPFDILIFLTKKNTGKTTQIYRHFKDCIEAGQKIIYMRASRVELDESVAHFKNDEDCPFLIVKTGFSYYLFRKEEINELLEIEGKHGLVVNYSWAIKKGVKEWGRCVSFKNCQSIGGASEWRDYAAIIFDECIPYTPENRLNRAVFANWSAFPSSIIRNKKEFKIYMYGNLLSTNNEILNFYGISRDDNLRYIERHDCKILYINAKEHYAGIGKQIGTAKHGAPEYMDQLVHNYLMLSNPRIITPTAFDLLEVQSVFCVDSTGIEDPPVIFEVRTGKCLTGKNYIALKVFTHKPYITYPDKKIYTRDPALSGAYDNLTYFNINGLIKRLLIAYHWKNLLFYDELSLSWMKELYSEYKELIGF